MNRLALAAALGSTLTLLAAWCTTGSRARRAVGVVIGVTVMLPPWLLDGWPALLRSVWALAAFVTTMRVVDLAGMDGPLTRRVAHVVSPVDSRRLERVRPRFELAAFVRVVARGAVCALGFVALARSRSHLARWALGAVIAYAGVAALYDFLRFAYGAAGFETPPLHAAPVLARSIQELWGERWARPINAWLRGTFFRPLARRRRPLAGLLVAFVVSAAFHAYAVWVGLGARRGLAMAGCMFAFFVAQAALMLLERALGVARWRAWAGHAWTIGWMVLLAPLFVEPLVRVLDASAL